MSRRSKNLLAAVGFALAGTAGAVSASADDSVNTGYFGGVAIMGYDPVAYFTENQAVKGSEKFSYEWLGTPWHFANNEHREMFMNEPVKYAPQYGGYCAGEVVGGSTTVNVDPEAFKIIDGKLYLIYDKGNAEKFANDADELVPKADSNWPKAVAELNRDPYH
jgi:YHS domain-containing protein